MPAVSLYPLRFEPILRRLIWGGRRLGTVLHKPIGEGNDYAESWEICRTIATRSASSTRGPRRDHPARPGAASRPRSCWGRTWPGRDQFPLLVKFIDAREVLSVQVHPDDEKGKRLAGDNGKTETWVIVDAEPGSLIYAGLKPGVTREQFARGHRGRAGRATPASFPAQARRLHHDRGGNRPRHRRGGLAGRDPADVRRDVPGL